MAKIYAQKSGELTKAEMLEMLKLLGRAGFTVRLGRERTGGKPTGAWIYFVEYWEEGKYGQDEN